MLIHKIQGISYPRSGRILLQKLTQQYFLDDCKIVQTMKKGDEGLISENGVNFGKTHCYGKTPPKTSKWRYVIQYRNPVRSLISHAYMVDPNYLQNTKTFKYFVKDKQVGISLWVNIMENWILDPQEQTVLIDYYYLLTDTRKQFSNLINLMTNEGFNESKYRRAFINIPIKPTLKLENVLLNIEFPIPMVRFFDEIEESVSDLMKRSGLLPWRKAI